MFEMGKILERKPVEIEKIDPQEQLYQKWRTVTLQELINERETIRAKLKPASNLQQNKDFQKSLSDLESQIKAFDSNMTEVYEREYNEMKLRLVYEAHCFEHSPDVVRGLNAYAKEGLRSNKNMDIQTIHWKNMFDANVILSAKYNEIPVYLFDIVNDKRMSELIDKNIEESKIKEAAINSLVIVLSGLQTIKSVKSIVDKKTTRRQFIKNSAMVGAAIGGGYVFGVEPGFFKLGEDHDRNNKLYQQIIEKFGLYDLANVFRNALWAQKLSLISEMEKRDDQEKPYIGVEVGGAHSTLENYIDMNEDKRLEVIRILAEKIEIENVEEELAIITKLTYSKKSDNWVKEHTIDESIVDYFKQHQAINK